MPFKKACSFIEEGISFLIFNAFGSLYALLAMGANAYLLPAVCCASLTRASWKPMDVLTHINHAGGGFQFSNPNAQDSCGCGKSFGV